ncbi:MAG TPA: PIG-L family deacetylase [Pseudonocardia sp.]|nr:PIG-L family deacetylase [Pseudonocardia sp.]
MGIPGSTTAAPGATVRDADDVAALGTVLGVWAHPDDEVYLSGGLMAAALAAGQRVVVVTATRGERGTDDPDALPPGPLAQLRRDELAASLALLGDGVEHRFLGDRIGAWYLDGRLAHGSGEPAVAELAAIVDEVAPDTVLTFGPDGMTGHSDHRAVSSWTSRALDRCAGAATRVLHATLSEAWVGRFGHLVEPMDDGADVFPVVPAAELAVDLGLPTALLDRKVAALRAQTSQTAPLERALGAQTYRAFVAHELFRPAPAGAGR